MGIGLAMYGHTWYKSQMNDWQKFGESPEKQSKCYGPFKDTYGGAPGKGCNQCGVMMNSEIEAAQCENYFDEQTKSSLYETWGLPENRLTWAVVNTCDLEEEQPDGCGVTV